MKLAIIITIVVVMLAFMVGGMFIADRVHEKTGSESKSSLALGTYLAIVTAIFILVCKALDVI